MVFARCGLWGANDHKEGEFAMAYYETQQQNPLHNSQFNPQQWGLFNPSMQGAGFGSGQSALGQAAYGQQQGVGYGLGQAAYGQQYGQYGTQPQIGAFGYNTGWGAQPQGLGQQQPQWWGQQQPQGFGQQQPQWWGQQQRQLSQQDVSEVVRQLLPALPQILAQAQQPHAALGYAAYGQAPYGQAPRLLSQQDVNEVVRQILPIVPQIVGMLQGQPQLQYAALQGGPSPFGQQYGGPQFQAAFGAPILAGQQRQLTQQDVADVTRQLVGLIPQVIGNLQAYNQQRMM
jgi:hypothetical protein